MRTTDISKYKEKEKQNKPKGGANPLKTALSIVTKTLLTILLVCFIAGVIVGFNVLIYLVDLASQPSGIDLNARSLNQSSFVYVQNPESEKFEEYQILYGSENRKWVEYDEMPPHLFDAIIAIEDKRFYEHNGVDWLRTGSAVINLATTGDDSYGGSTITQQLIKNLTHEDDASINRKVREIIKALKLEQEYTKDEILEAYLNVVNFGGTCQGVEAAANRYFDKSISECSIAECAAIVGITQNPSAWDPFIYPDNNVLRRNLIIDEMYSQGKITEEEYNAAVEESKNMKFADPYAGNVDINVGDVQNWYMDELVEDLSADLAELYNITPEAARDKLYTEGYKIYAAMDVEAQKIIEEEAVNIDKSSDPDLEIGMCLIAPDGRILATAGSSVKKDSNLLHSRSSMSYLQTGSSIKPVFAYPGVIERKLGNYSSYISDEPLEEWVYADGSHGPDNWYGYNYEHGLKIVNAVERSSNCCAAQAIKLMGGPEAAYDHAVNNMRFEHLYEEDRYNYSALSLGGMSGGVSPREMANAYTYLINGGLNNKPFNYYYVTDQRGNVILDNRNNSAYRAYSEDTATIMNRILYYNVNSGDNSTYACYTQMSDWEICGKTGTTNDDYDSWFCGVSPYAALSVWTGFDDPHRINDTSVAASTFYNVMSRYLEDKEYKDYELSDAVVTAKYCTVTGKLAGDKCDETATGYYTEDNMPSKCTSHAGFEEKTTTPTGPQTEYEKPTTEATVSVTIEILTESSEPVTENKPQEPAEPGTTQEN